MRISDWSSDVCSSDLLVSPDRAVILGGIGLDLQEWSYSKPDAEAATFIMVGRLLRDKGVEEYVEAAKALHPHYPKAHFLLVGGHDENPAAMSLAEVQSWVRSEEHTSELQSLMRISYAVFCLKTKK